MKIIYNNIIPFKGFVAMAMWPFVFVRKDEVGPYLKYTLNHEKIHHAQQKELGVIPFYILYVGEWIINIFRFGPFGHKAYRRISFEQEASAYWIELDYLEHRKHYAQWTKKTREDFSARYPRG